MATKLEHPILIQKVVNIYIYIDDERGWKLGTEFSCVWLYSITNKDFWYLVISLLPRS